MKEHPILFSSPMVRAILSGRKSMTRRVIKPQPGNAEEALLRGMGFGDKRNPSCPYETGMKMWVRETWRPELHTNGKPMDCADPMIGYKATDTNEACMPISDQQFASINKNWERHWRPSIHMPRWACRLLLEVTDVRVERVQDISEEDARAEGVDWQAWEQGGEPIPAKSLFHELWDNINARRGFDWDRNVWVWVVEFKVIKK